MTDLVVTFRQAQDEFTKRVAHVGDDQWAAPTPDDEWTVTDLVAHMVDEHLWAPPLLEGHLLAEAGKIAEGAKRTFAGQPAEAWDAAALGSMEAVSEPGVLERDVDLSRGSTPVPEYLNEMILDLVVHSWDLGTAVGVTDPLPEALVSYAMQVANDMGDLSASGAFKPPVEIGDEASDEQKLVAMTGRHPH